MKKLFFQIILVASAGFFSTSLSSQTAGVLTFSFMPVAKTPTYNGNSQHVLAAWIQTNTGGFVKTKLRYAGGGTSDHLPTWAVNAGGSASNCLSTSCNKTDATTGATLSSWAATTFTWDAKNVSGASNGTVVADGVYKVTLQETWDHGSTGTAITSYTFTKGAGPDHQIITADANFGNILIDWIPASGTVTTTGINETTLENPELVIYPNPSAGNITVDFKKADHIKVLNTLGVSVYDEKLEADGTRSIDFNNFANGIYIITISNQKGSSNRKFILNK